jgi:hypothetical protein
MVARGRGARPAGAGRRPPRSGDARRTCGKVPDTLAGVSASNQPAVAWPATAAWSAGSARRSNRRQPERAVTDDRHRRARIDAGAHRTVVARHRPAASGAERDQAGPLTAQEAQIARLARRPLQPDGAQLFISPRYRARTPCSTAQRGETLSASALDAARPSVSVRYQAARASPMRSGESSCTK